MKEQDTPRRLLPFPSLLPTGHGAAGGGGGEEHSPQLRWPFQRPGARCQSGYGKHLPKAQPCPLSLWPQTNSLVFIPFVAELGGSFLPLWVELVLLIKPCPLQNLPGLERE